MASTLKFVRLREDIRKTLTRPVFMNEPENELVFQETGMMFGVALAAIIATQTAGVSALWAAPSASRRVTKRLPLRAEEENELVQENKDLRHRLAMMTQDRDRLSKNEIAAIEKRDEYQLERNELQVRCDDLLKECKRLRKASIRSEIEDKDGY